MKPGSYRDPATLEPALFWEVCRMSGAIGVVDPHDWWNGACKRCHAEYQSFVDGTSPRCKSVVRSMAADEFASINRRMKEIEAAERTAALEPSVAWTKPRLREPTAQEIALEDGYWFHSWRTV